MINPDIFIVFMLELKTGMQTAIEQKSNSRDRKIQENDSSDLYLVCIKLTDDSTERRCVHVHSMVT